MIFKLAPTGIIHPATEDYDVLRKIVEYYYNNLSIFMPSVHWEEYNLTGDVFKLLKINYPIIIIENHSNVNIANIIISPHVSYQEIMLNPAKPFAF